MDRGVLLLIPVSGLIAAGAKPEAGSLPPGRQYRLTIEGDNTITFLPQVGLDPIRVDYLARVEYLVNTRSIGEANAGGDATVKKQAGRKAAGVSNKSKRKGGENIASKVAGAVDVAIDSSEMDLRQNGRPVALESRISRARFQGRVLGPMPRA